MKIDLNPLFSGMKKEIMFEEIISFQEKDLKNTSIKGLDKVKINGNITKISEESVNLKMDIKSSMTLEDSITLEEIEYPVNIQFNRIIDNNEEDEVKFTTVCCSI